MRFSIICGMALRDYWHERALSLCAVLALATVLAPLLILFGVRNGVISNLQERLLQDPRNHSCDHRPAPRLRKKRRAIPQPGQRQPHPFRRG